MLKLLQLNEKVEIFLQQTFIYLFFTQTTSFIYEGKVSIRFLRKTNLGCEITNKSESGVKFAYV